METVFAQQRAKFIGPMFIGPIGPAPALRIDWHNHPADQKVQWWNPAKSEYEWIRAADLALKAAAADAEDWTTQPKPGDRVALDGKGITGTITVSYPVLKRAQVTWDNGTRSEELLARLVTLVDLHLERPFKVGDRVKFVPPHDGPRGVSGTVAALLPGTMPIRVAWDNGVEYNYMPQELRHVDTVPFKVGDRVRRANGGTTISKDWVGEVTQVTADTIRVQWDHGGVPIIYSARELELIPDDQKERKTRYMSRAYDNRDYIPGRRVCSRNDPRRLGTIVATRKSAVYDEIEVLVHWDGNKGAGWTVRDQVVCRFEYDEEWELL